MNIMVTGATGFIGGCLTRELVRRGENVDALVRSPGRAQDLSKMGVGLVKGDVTNPSSLQDKLGKYDTIFHLANVYDWWAPDDSVFYKVNVEGTRNLLLEAKKAGVGKIVYTSTTLAIGPRKGEMGTERTEHCGLYTGEYCRTKHLALGEAMRLAAEGLPIITVMPAGVIGPDATKSTGQTIVAFLKGDIPGLVYPNSIVAYVYVNDVVNGHLLAAEKGRFGEKYILAEGNYSNRAFFDMLAEVADAPKLKRVIPPWMAMFMSGVQEVGASLTGRPPQIPKSALKMMSEGIIVDNSRSVQELGVEYTPIRQALQETVEWCRANGLATPHGSK